MSKKTLEGIRKVMFQELPHSIVDHAIVKDDAICIYPYQTNLNDMMALSLFCRDRNLGFLLYGGKSAYGHGTFTIEVKEKI